MAGSGRPTVLIVDDEPDVADVYAARLSDEYDVRTAYSGTEALEKFDKSVSVTLLDRRLPYSSSDEILEQMNEHPAECRIALVTAVVPDFDIVDMDIDDYLVKPVDKTDMKNTVEKMLARSDYQELLREYFALLSKYATLKTHKTEAELKASPEFARLKSQVAQRRGEVEELTAEFDAEDFRLLCLDLA